MPDVDYDALAAQHGGTAAAPAPVTSPTVDYDALAAQHGGQAMTPTFRSENEKDANGRPAVTPDWIDKLTSWLPAIGGTVGGLGGTLTDPVTGPVGTVMGAALGGMAGEAYKELINRARGRVKAPDGSWAAAKAIGAEGATQGAAQAVGDVVAAPVMRAVGARVMQSAIKPGLRTLLRGADADLQPVVKTMLDEGVNVSPNGVKKLQMLLTATKADIRNAINSAGGATIPPLRVASRLSDAARTFATQVNPQADLEAISRVGQNFLDAHGATDLTLPDAQALKVGTYRVLRDKFGQMGAAETEAEKSLARGLKEELEQHVPGISALNEREGRLIQTLSEVGKRAALTGNKDPIGFAWVAHNPTMFLAALIDRNPAIKSLMARGLYNHAGQIAQVPPALIRTAVHALATDDPQGALDRTSSDQGRPR